MNEWIFWRLYLFIYAWFFLILFFINLLVDLFYQIIFLIFLAFWGLTVDLKCLKILILLIFKFNINSQIAKPIIYYQPFF